jgi:hypothetical protein
LRSVIERYLTQPIDEVRKREFFRRGGGYRHAIQKSNLFCLPEF